MCDFAQYRATHRISWSRFKKNISNLMSYFFLYSISFGVGRREGQISDVCTIERKYKQHQLLSPAFHALTVLINYIG